MSESKVNLSNILELRTVGKYKVLFSKSEGTDECEVQIVADNCSIILSRIISDSYYALEVTDIAREMTVLLRKLDEYYDKDSKKLAEQYRKDMI